MKLNRRKIMKLKSIYTLSFLIISSLSAGCGSRDYDESSDTNVSPASPIITPSTQTPQKTLTSEEVSDFSSNKLKLTPSTQFGVQDYYRLRDTLQRRNIILSTLSGAIISSATYLIMHSRHKPEGKEPKMKVAKKTFVAGVFGGICGASLSALGSIYLPQVPAPANVTTTTIIAPAPASDQDKKELNLR
jgi:hypothetical protein